MTGWLASYRVRLPLALSLTAVVTALMMALALGLQTLHNLREDQARNARQLGYALTELLVKALREDDVWLAYALLRGPDVPDAHGGGSDATLVWVLADGAGRVFASNRPRDYPLDSPLPAALIQAESVRAARPALQMPDGSAVRQVIRLPLASDGTPVGELIALLSDRPFLTRFREILFGGLLVTTTVLGLVLPLGWLWGRRLVAPLVLLADCLGRVGHADPRTLACRLPDGADEIGQLGRRFCAMLAALAAQAALERRVVQAERLAAVGRVAAGVAHEINNPLGGMVMAIDTWRAGGPADGRTNRLLDLLDRGLRQIQDTVSALLVEARADHRVLTAGDLEDVRTLAAPRLIRGGAPLHWQVAFDATSSLPATPVRQLLLNLVLNALNAARPTGTVAVRVQTTATALLIEVDNTGRPLPPERREHPFEPYPAPGGGGEGFGLWVCYQIVSQLGGSIEVTAVGERTLVQVRLPLHPGQPPEPGLPTGTGPLEPGPTTAGPGDSGRPTGS